MDLSAVDLDPATLLLLRAARETDALAALATDAGTPAEVAERTDLDRRAADLIVDSLAREGFLECVGDAYEPTDPMLGFLGAADLRSVGRLPAALDAVDALVALPETMTSGEQVETTIEGGDDLAGDALARTLGAREGTPEATVRAVTTEALRHAPDAATVTDVLGAPGHYGRAFAALDRDVTLADRPAAVERATPLLARTEVSTATVESGDPLPDADLLFAGDVVRRTPPTAVQDLLDRVRSAAAPDGLVVLAEFVAGRSERAVPERITAYARHGGDVHGVDRYREWFDSAGLGEPTVADVPGTDRQVVVGAPEA